jgi:hypothetical protein
MGWGSMQPSLGVERAWTYAGRWNLRPISGPFGLACPLIAGVGPESQQAEPPGLIDGVDAQAGQTPGRAQAAGLVR